MPALTDAGAALHDALLAPDPTPTLHALGRTSQFVTDLPELADLQLMGTGQGRWRHKDTWAHSIQVAAKAPADDVVLRYAALLHDIGKPATRAMRPDGTVTFHNHEAVGGRQAHRMLTRLGHSTDLIDDVTAIVTLSGRFKADPAGAGWTDAAVRRFIRDTGPVMPTLLDLATIDVTSRHAHRHAAVAEGVAHLRTRIQEVTAADARAAERPDIDGHTLMAELDLPPGPTVGTLLSHLLDCKRTNGPMGRDAALAEARRHLATLTT